MPFNIFNISCYIFHITYWSTKLKILKLNLTKKAWNSCLLFLILLSHLFPLSLFSFYYSKHICKLFTPFLLSTLSRFVYAMKSMLISVTVRFASYGNPNWDYSAVPSTEVPSSFPLGHIGPPHNSSSSTWVFRPAWWPSLREWCNTHTHTHTHAMPY